MNTVARTAVVVAVVVFATLLVSSCGDLQEVLDPQVLDPPCYGSNFERCQEAQVELEPIAQATCPGEGRRICLAPLGGVSTSLVEHLVEHFREEYGLTVTVLRPMAVPDRVIDPDRDQLGGIALIEFMRGAYASISTDPQAVVIGLTPLDLYFEERDWRFAFGVRGSRQDPDAVVSTFRMNPETYGEDRNEDLLFTRARKMVTKFVGLLYYGLAEDPNPESPLYDSILSLDDLDRMREPLPVAGRARSH